VRDHDEKNKTLKKGAKNMSLHRVFLAAFVLLLSGGLLFERPAYSEDNREVSETSPNSNTQEAQDKNKELLLSLPAFDLDLAQDRVNQTGFRIGDELLLKALALEVPGIKNPAQELRLDASSVESKGDEQSWTVEQKASHTPGMEGKFLISAVPLKPGKLVIPSLILKDLSGKPVARTNPFSIQVESAIKTNDPKPQEPAEIQPPVDLVFPWWVLVFLGLVVLALLVGLIYGINRWRNKSRPVAPPPPTIVLPEDEVALGRLAALEQEGLLAKGQFKPHYFKASEILKFYIGARYRFDALESTAREILQALDEKKIVSDLTITQLEKVFSRLDRVKFTDHVPDSAEASGLVAEVREIVQSTRRPPVSSVQTGVELNASR
jgi:hypothetical protein